MNFRTIPKRKKLFWKILTYAVAMLLGMVAVISLLIYFMIPPFYRTLQRNQYEQLLVTNENFLAESDSLITEIQIITDVLSFSNAGFSIFDDNDTLLFEYNSTHANWDFFQLDPDILNTIDDSELGFRVPNHLPPLSDQTTSPTIIYFNYHTLLGQRTVQVRIPTQPLDDARNVILTIFPIAGGIALTVALLISIVFSRWVVIPIKNIQKITTSMADFESDSLIPITTHDEIGELSKGINHLFEQLKNAINTLEIEIKRVRDSENRKIDFLQTVSHEMKTPLATANSLIEGLRYKIPPYADNPDHYLEEVQAYLAKAITLTKESLKLAELGREQTEIFTLESVLKQCVSSYNVILLSKQISSDINVPNELTLEINRNLFEKVLSNLYSNAIYHNNNDGLIEISYDSGRLTIFNTCTPLAPDEIVNLFEPLTNTSGDELSTGIGLYIVKQLLQQLKIPFQFTPDEHKTGMNFILDLKSIIRDGEKDDSDS